MKDIPTEVSSPGVPAAISAQVPEGIRPLAGCRRAAPRQATTPLSRGGLQHAPRAPTMPSADFCGAVREDSSALSSTPGHPADLPRSAVRPSVHSRPIDTAQSSCGGRTSRARARSSRLSHTSYRVRVPRPARAFHASFRPHLAVTPLRFPCPSAPRIPGQGTFTPKHDSMHGTHGQS
jgi:hypothetical protein